MKFTDHMPWQITVAVWVGLLLLFLTPVLLMAAVAWLCWRIEIMFRFKWLKPVEVVRGPYKGAVGKLVARRFLLRFVIDAQGTTFALRVWRWQVKPTAPR